MLPPLPHWLKSKLIPLACFCMGWQMPFSAAQKSPDYKKTSPNDTVGSYAGSPLPYNPAPLYDKVEIKSLYLTMRDSALLAVDIYLPKDRKAGEKMPVLLHQTRYWRRPQMRFPYNLLSKGLLGRTGTMIKELVKQGYVIVNVDVRGSGASTGVQLHPWTKDEVQDGYEIIDWIIAQEWSNGNVGSVGVSYSGTAAEMLATLQHPNLKAIVPMFSLFDVYEDNAFIGGIHNRWFTESWGRANEAMDANKLPENYRSARKYIKGVAMVKQPQHKAIFKQALNEHKANRNVHEGALTMDCRDDAAFEGLIPSLDAFSPHAYIEQLDKSKVAVYSYSGWHDGAYQYSALKRHWNLEDNPNHKVILGAWEHGGAFLISPFCRAKAGFDHTGEILKFFDYHLKGVKNGIEKEQPIHYYTMGLERWQANNTFPPDYTQPVCYYLNGENLGTNPNTSEKTHTITLDTSWGSGDQSRWKAVNGKIKSPITYLDWTERSAKLTHWETPILDKDTEMTGIPLLEFFVSSALPDAGLFVYLEDVQENGQVYQVTEGLLRLSHRNLQSENNFYHHPLATRSHLREDIQPLNPNEITSVKMDLLPVSYLFKKGHKIRISVSLCDKDHFEIINTQGSQLNFHQSAQYQPKLWLDIRK